MTIHDAGAADASPAIVVHQTPQWGARVTVRAIDYAGSTGRRFQIIATWHGPPMADFPPRHGDPPCADRTDTHLLTDLELAKHVAGLAAEELRQARVPDLRELERRARALAGSPPK